MQLAMDGGGDVEEVNANYPSLTIVNFWFAICMESVPDLLNGQPISTPCCWRGFAAYLKKHFLRIGF